MVQCVRIVARGLQAVGWVIWVVEGLFLESSLHAAIVRQCFRKFSLLKHNLFDKVECISFLFWDVQVNEGTEARVVGAVGTFKISPS